MSNRTLTWVVAVISLTLLGNLVLSAYLFYTRSDTAGPAIPATLGLQVSLASFLFVMVSLVQAFLGFAKLGEIEEKAIANARNVATDTIQDLLGQGDSSVPSAAARLAGFDIEDLTGENEESTGGGSS